MMARSIAAKDVKIGDHIYNQHGYCERARWVRVTSVEECATVTTLEFGRVVPCKGIKIDTGVFYTIKYPEEGIVVKRGEHGSDPHV